MTRSLVKASRSLSWRPTKSSAMLNRISLSECRAEHQFADGPASAVCQPLRPVAVCDPQPQGIFGMLSLMRLGLDVTSSSCRTTRVRGGYDEELALVYLRQARTAVVTMTVLAVVGVIAILIIGIVVAVGISHENHLLNQQLSGATSSNCLSHGGPDPSC